MRSVPGLEVSVEDDVVNLTIDNGDENRFTVEMMIALVEAVETAAARSEVRFVRMGARGSVFCLGRERRPGAPDEVRSVADTIVRVNEILRSTPLVVVAEVQGDAAGFGAGLVASADVAVASRDAAFYFPEIQSGLAPAVVLSWLTFLLPPKRAFEMAATGTPIDGDRAASFGLITEAVDPSALAARIDDWLARLRAMDGRALRDIKRFIVLAREMTPASAAQASVDSLALASLRSMQQSLTAPKDDGR